MHLSELLLAYKHLPILDTMLLTDDEKLYEFILIKKEDEGYVVEPKKDLCNATGALSSYIKLDSFFELIETSCGCLEHYRKKKCVHTAILYALSLKILCPEKYEAQIEAYKRTKLALEQDVILNDLASDLRSNAFYFKKIHLTPEIIYQGEVFMLSLRISYDKEYVIKSINEFLDLMENKKYFSYGQKLSFVHSYEVLDDVSKEFYSYLLSIRRDDALKSIQIKKSHFFNIMEIYHNNGIYFATDIIKLDFYNIKELDSLSLVLNDQYLQMIRPYQTERLLCSVNYAYFIGETNIYAYHFKKRNEAIIINALFRCQNQGISIEANEVDFISNLFPLIKKEISIEDSFYRKYHLPDVVIHSYFSYKDGKIINKNKVEVEEKYIDTPYVNQILESYSMAIESFGFEKKNNQAYFLTSIEQQYAFLTSDLSGIKNYGDIFFDSSIKRIRLKKSSRINVNVTYNIGLLDFKFDDKLLTIEKIEAMLQAYHNKMRYIKLKNDVILEVNEEDAKELNNFLEDFNITEKNLKTTISKPLNYILKLIHGREENVHIDEKLFTMIQEIRNYKKSSILPTTEFQQYLRPYQVEAFQWLSVLAKFGFGGILADDMGLGKTLEILSFLSKDEIEEPSLIVCPMSLVYNWQNESKKWNLRAPVRLIIGNALEREAIIKNIAPNMKAIYITSYDSLRRDIELYSVRFRSIIADEAQYIKNQNTLKSVAIKQIPAALHFALTGTPIENGLADLWSIFDFLMPGYLSNYHHFKTRYETLIMEDDEETLALLKKRVQPFILRRTKKDVLKELPEKMEEIYYCKMDGPQEEIYQTYIEKIKNDLSAGGNQILALITRLRQICLSPKLIFDDDLPSAKLNLALELITRAIASNHRILIFSQFASVFPIVSSMLTMENIPHFCIDGKTSAQKRIDLVEEFNKNLNIKVFLISLKAGGTGLNLTGADMVIHLDPWWNVSAEHQATDRAHRIGQTRKVHVLKLVCMDSIEEKVMLLQHLKSTLADEILKEEKFTLSKNDILELIS